MALGVTLTFVAYLIGTFFNEVRGPVARVYLRARQSASGDASANRRVAVIETARLRRRERRQERREIRLKGLEGETPRELPLSRNRDRESVTAAFITGFSRGLIEAAAITSQGVGALIHSSSVVIEASVEAVEELQDAILMAVRRLTSIRIEPYKPFVSQEGAAAIERYLKQTKQGITFGKASERSWPTAADVIADFPIIRTRLIHKSPDTVSEYDRLRAEADFRSAIVLPLLAIISLFAIKVSWHWGLVAVLLLILLATARQKRREAGDILADTLGIVDAPCVENRSTN